MDGRQGNEFSMCVCVYQNERENKNNIQPVADDLLSGRTEPLLDFLRPAILHSCRA